MYHYGDNEIHNLDGGMKGHGKNAAMKLRGNWWMMVEQNEVKPADGPVLKDNSREPTVGY